MSKRHILVGSVDQTIDVFIQSNAVTTGAGLTGLVFNTASLTCYYRKGATGTPTALTLATQTVGGAHSDGGFVAVDGTNCPGQYRLDLSDTIVAAAGAVTLYLQGAANMAPCLVEIEVVNFCHTGQSATDLKDFADDGYDPATNKVQGVVLTDTVTTYTGNTPQTGDSFLRLTGTGAVTFASLTVSGATTLTGALTATNASNNLTLGTFTVTTNAVGWNASWDTEVQSEVDDALKATLTEGYRSTGAVGSVRDMLYEIIAHMGESSIASTTKTLKKLDGSTTAKTYTLDSATVPTSITETT